MVPFESIWPQVAPLVAKAERPSRYINHEWGSVYKPEAGFRFCMVYPDTYELGQANQALRILVNAVNARDGMVAERGFLPAPDMCDALRREGLPLFSIESCAPLGAFDVIGITLPHELAATNVLEALDLAGLPLHAVDRSEDDPLVVAGGPCALNPEPYAPFFDAINIGEGEESLPEGLEVIRTQRARGASRREIWRALAALDGFIAGILVARRSTNVHVALLVDKACETRTVKGIGAFATIAIASTNMLVGFLHQVVYQHLVVIENLAIVGVEEVKVINFLVHANLKDLLAVVNIV